MDLVVPVSALEKSSSRFVIVSNADSKADAFVVKATSVSKVVASVALSEISVPAASRRAVSVPGIIRCRVKANRGFASACAAPPVDARAVVTELNWDSASA